MLEHTADIRIRACARSLPGLFAASARGMAAYLFAPAVLAGPVEGRERLRIAAHDLHALLVDWLAELLFRSSTERRAFIEFEFEYLDDTGLSASAGWRAAQMEEEIKAVTHHDLMITSKAESGLWQAIVTYDI